MSDSRDPLGELDPVLEGEDITPEERRRLIALFGRIRRRFAAVRRNWTLAIVLMLAAAPFAFLVGRYYLGFAALVLAGCYYAGLRSIHRHPFGWSVALAVETTVFFAISLLFEQERTDYFGGLWVIAFWSTVPMAAQVSEAMRNYPRLFNPERLRTGAARGRQAGGAVDRRRAERSRFWKTIGAATAASLVLLVGGVKFWQALNLPRPIEPRVEALEAALRASDLEAARDLALPKMAENESFWRKSEELLVREEWNDGGVPLGEPSILESTSTRHQVRYELPRGNLVVSWRRPDREWMLSGLRFKGLRD